MHVPLFCTKVSCEVFDIFSAVIWPLYQSVFENVPTVNKNSTGVKRGLGNKTHSRLFGPRNKQTLQLCFTALISEEIKVMSAKTCSSNSVAQAQKLIHQLRIEAGMERLKVRVQLYHSDNTYLYIYVIIYPCNF